MNNRGGYLKRLLVIVVAIFVGYRVVAYNRVTRNYELKLWKYFLGSTMCQTVNGLSKAWFTEYEDLKVKYNLDHAYSDYVY